MRLCPGTNVVCSFWPPCDQCERVRLGKVIASSQRPMTPKEIYEQKVSWIRGMSGKLADPMRSREDVVKALESLGIVDPDPSKNPNGDTGRDGREAEKDAGRCRRARGGGVGD